MFFGHLVTSKVEYAVKKQRQVISFDVIQATV